MRNSRLQRRHKYAFRLCRLTTCYVDWCTYKKKKKKNRPLPYILRNVLTKAIPDVSENTLVVPGLLEFKGTEYVPMIMKPYFWPLFAYYIP